MTETQADPRGSEAADTKERLLDAAERLFAERGFRGASMRAVTQAAGSAVSAANYHFGSKEELLAAVLRRRLQPVNQARLAALDQLEGEAGATEVSVESLLEAFYRPSFERLSVARVAGQKSTPREVIARLYTEPLELVQPLKAELFGEVNARYMAAFARVFPGLSERRLQLIQQLAIASMIHVLSGQLDDDLTRLLEADAEEGEAPHEPLLQTLIAHSAAGARAVAAQGQVTANGKGA
jgi:AcrR family transcriptional regulator